ncbi:class I SAM-dependent methyltransferase [Thiobacillus sedimenti]|uniref:Class I SAM-dependent methyltransferase n=1 Tax=Thiobacillus sedimenti TaxID=3110231 RepID=A0ABZ1CMV3_9PROT|nr:class I SAM-dependent methyltransferase [Thiobacillus sp. SCUT-2]WRS40725.1 class I SAM-dependent methyltransferase [Thiobacillus sp. SCUT-2]
MSDHPELPPPTENQMESHLELEEIPLCLLCRSQGTVLHEGLTDRLYGVPGQWRIRQCQSDACGLLWLDPRPTPRDIGKAYADYFTHDSSSHPRPRTDFLSRAAELRGRLLRKLWQSSSGQKKARRAGDLMYLDDIKPGRLLEIGCGNGRRLAQFRDRGWRAEGQEVDAQAARYARDRLGLTIHEGPVTDLKLAADSYDAIVLSHVIEHVHDPVGLLAEAHRLLRPGGVLSVTTPNALGLGHRTFGTNWYGLDAPRHLFLFSSRTLAAVARKSGFGTVRTWTTAAHAATFSTPSLAIQTHGRVDMAARPDVARLLAGTAFQLWAQQYLKFDPDSGEECVLRATK